MSTSLIVGIAVMVVSFVLDFEPWRVKDRLQQRIPSFTDRWWYTLVIATFGAGLVTVIVDGIASERESEVIHSRIEQIQSGIRYVSAEVDVELSGDWTNRPSMTVSAEYPGDLALVFAYPPQATSGEDLVSDPRHLRLFTLKRRVSRADDISRVVFHAEIRSDSSFIGKAPDVIEQSTELVVAVLGRIPSVNSVTELRLRSLSATVLVNGERQYSIARSFEPERTLRWGDSIAIRLTPNDLQPRELASKEPNRK